jgi:hypothetical protein
MSLDNPFV